MAPDDAFGALGNETRVDILRVLGEAEEPLSFSTLRDRVGVRDSGRFNYHLDELVGHFVAKTEAGYWLRQAGRRVVEAVLSGTVTDDPIIDPTEIDQPCPHCGAPTVVSYRGEWVGYACTECDGAVAPEGAPSTVPAEVEQGYLGGYMLPPAGVESRSVSEVLATARRWSMTENLALGQGFCPRCSAPVEHSIEVCEEHDGSDGPCAACGLRHAVLAETHCANCTYGMRATFVLQFLSRTPVLSFLTDHGYNPHDPSAELRRAIGTHDVTVESTDPFEGQFELTLDDDTLRFSVEGTTITDTSRE